MTQGSSHWTGAHTSRTRLDSGTETRVVTGTVTHWSLTTTNYSNKSNFKGAGEKPEPSRKVYSDRTRPVAI